MIFTDSVFYFGTTVNSDNFRLPFDEGGPELNAELDFGGYSLTELLDETKKAMDTAGGQSYTVSVDRDTRFVTISAVGVFSLLLSSGSTVGTSVFSLLGFSQGSDLTGASTYTGASPSGSEYRPQFKLQNFVDKEDSQAASQGTTYKSASGAVETVTFGIEKFFEMNIKFATNNDMGCGAIKGNPTGVENLRAFMQFITTKARFEFIPDIDDTSIFDRVILESSPGNNQGIGYKLRELFNQGLPGIFETGVLKMRVIE